MAISLISVPGIAGLLGAGLALTMLAIAWIDVRSFIIPDRFNLIALALGLTHAVVYVVAPAGWGFSWTLPDAVPTPGEATTAMDSPLVSALISTIAIAILRGAALALVLLAIRFSYARLRGREGLGLGDVKLAFVAGVWLDWRTMPLAIELAAVAALFVYGARWMLLGHAISRTSRIPFGAFLAPAIWVGWILESRWLV